MGVIGGTHQADPFLDGAGRASRALVRAAAPTRSKDACIDGQALHFLQGAVHPGQLRLRSESIVGSGGGVAAEWRPLAQECPAAMLHPVCPNPSRNVDSK